MGMPLDSVLGPFLFLVMFSLAQLHVQQDDNERISKISRKKMHLTEMKKNLDVLSY